MLRWKRKNCRISSEIIGRRKLFAIESPDVRHIDESTQTTEIQNQAQTAQQSAQSSPETTQSTTSSNTSLSETRHPTAQQNSSPDSTSASANSVTSITGNVINEAGLETDLSNILEPSNATTSTETSIEQTTSDVVPMPQLHKII